MLQDTTDKMMRRKRKVGWQPRDDGDEGKQREVGKRIHCKVTQKTYEVRYATADGTIKRTVKGLKVPSSDNKGRPLQPDAYDEIMHSTFRAAQAMWNDLDHSGEKRFKLE